MHSIFGVMAGGCVGLALSLLGRCSCNTCPVTKNPWVSIVLGALMGYLITAVR